MKYFVGPTQYLHTNMCTHKHAHKPILSRSQPSSPPPPPAHTNKNIQMGACAMPNNSNSPTQYFRAHTHVYIHSLSHSHAQSFPPHTIIPPSAPSSNPASAHIHMQHDSDDEPTRYFRAQTHVHKHTLSHTLHTYKHIHIDALALQIDNFESNSLI